jgi:cytoskeletal protein RodZ
MGMVKGAVWVVVLLLGVFGVASGRVAPDKPQQEQSPAEQSQSQSQEPDSSSQAPAANPQTQSPVENQSASPPSTPRDPDVPVLKRRTAKKKRATPKSNSGKVVVRNGGAKEGSAELAPAMSKEQERHNRENTSQLLATTDANLKTVSSRQLTSTQQSMLEEIRTYVAQSKAATNAGDVARAHTLAYKAHLLSDELAKK